MAVKVAELYETLELDTRKFKKDMSAAKKDTGKFSKMLGGIGTAAAAGAAAAGAALAGAAAKGVKEFANFDKQMNEVFTLMPKASEEAQKQMSSDLRAFSNEMGVATDEAAPALYQAISAGVPKDNVFNFMEEAQKAATAGVTDLTTSVDVLSSVVNTYGKENISAAEASDLMFTAVRQGKTTFEELSTNMSDVAPIASSMGIEFSNITASLSTMTSQGTPTTKATTQLKQAMAELSKEGSKAGTAFAKVAGTDFQTFISEGGNLQEAMALMEAAAKENGTTVSNMFGSIEAGQAALALTGKGAEKFKGDLEEMNSASGATDKAYKKMEESLTRNFERIQVGMNEVWLTVGEQLMPIMKDLTDWVIANMPKIQATAETVFSAVSDAIYLGIDAYKTIKSFVSGFVSDNSESLNTVMSDYQEIFASIKQIITIFVGWAQNFWSAYGENITKAAKTTWASIKQIFNMQLDNIRDIFQSIVKLMKGDFKGFGKELGNIGSRTFDALADIFERQWKSVIKPAVSEIVEKIIKGFQELPSKMKEAGEDMISGMKEGITGKLGAVVNAVKNVGTSIIDKTKSIFEIKSPSRVFARIGANLIEGLNLGMTKNEVLIKTLTDIGEKMHSTMEKAFFNIIKGTQNVTEAFGQLWNSILDEIMRKLAEMAASKVFGWILGGGSGGGLLSGIFDFIGGIFHQGGTIPGPIGQEVPIMAKAGESVSPIGSNNFSGGGGYKSANITVQLDSRTIAQAVKQPLVDSIRIKGGARY